jgi:hypothetical protein
MRRALFPLALLLACSAQAAEGFHDVETEAERALDAILKRVDHDHQALDNLLGGRGPGFRRTVDYRTMITPPALAAIAAHEKEVVKRTCGGRYRDGEICGLDYVPVTCAQDSNPVYFYRTLSASADRAEIAQKWPYSKEPGATYRLVRDGGGWKIDGIRCTGADAFNMGARQP